MPRLFHNYSENSNVTSEYNYFQPTDFSFPTCRAKKMSFGSPDGTFLWNITVVQSMRRLKLKTVLAIKATRNMQNLSCQGHPHKSYQPSCLQHPPRRRRFESTPIPEQRFHQLIWQLNSCSNLTVLSLSEATSELKSDMQKKLEAHKLIPDPALIRLHAMHLK